MTKSQQIAIEKFKKNALQACANMHKEMEIKAENIKEYRDFVAYELVIGGKNDEGTMAAIFAREQAHIFIGKRGGITYPTIREGVKRLKGYSFLTVHIEQK